MFENNNSYAPVSTEASGKRDLNTNEITQVSGGADFSQTQAGQQYESAIKLGNKNLAASILLREYEKTKVTAEQAAFIVDMFGPKGVDILGGGSIWPR